MASRAARYSGGAHEGKINILGLPRIIRPKETLQNWNTARFMGIPVLEKAVALWRRFSVHHYVGSHSVPRGDIAIYRTSISVCCADPTEAQPGAESVS
jgi:hypothetical protein